jgi:hypothetical protein
MGTTSYALGASQSQAFTVRFTAPAVQPGHAVSYVRMIDLGSAACATFSPVTVQATAIPPPPVCAIAPDSLKFGGVQVGQSRDLTFQVTNIGGAGSLLSGQVTLGCAGFTLVGPTSQYDLGAGQSATFTVRFAPTSTGPQQCWVNAGGCPPILAIGNGQ